MTEPRRRRWSKRTLRGIAWVAGGAAFAAPFASLTVSPKPASAEQAQGEDRSVVVVRRITRRVVVQPAPTAPEVRYVYVGGGSPSGSNGASTATTGGSTSVAAPAPAPAPATTTGGS